MALDPNFVVAVSQQEVFTDKDTGLVLANGEIRFFKDEDRASTKDVFVLTGAPDYSYVNIGSTVSINAAGSPAYLGNNINIYYFPFDADGEVERYYVQVVDSSGSEQFTREAKPNFFGASAGGDIGGSAFINYIPNGQFVSHIDLPDSGLIVDPITPIALGGWTFNRPAGSDAIDNVTFSRFNSYSENPESHPRYSMDIVNSSGGAGDLSKDARVRFDDVSRFGSDETEYTFKFSARSLSGVLDDVELVLIKNYGTGVGASGETETPLGSFSITGSFTSHLLTFTFGDNSDKTIGPNNDDYLELALRFPSNVVFHAQLTNATLVRGNFSEVDFPEASTRQSISQSLGGAFPIPDPNGLDLYLTPRLTQTGWEFDHSEIGRVIAKSVSTVDVGELLADGASYFTSEKSADLIPYIRLQQRYFDALTQTMTHGTGLDNMTAYSPGISGTASIMLVSNAQGLASNAADVSTGFAFSSPYVSLSMPYGINTWIESIGKTYSQSQTDGVVALPGAGTSTVNFDLIIEGTAQTPIEFATSYPAGAAFVTGGVALYWEFDLPGNAFYVWYDTGTETDPPVGGGRVGIKVSVSASDTDQIVAEKTAAALSNYSASAISTIAAGGMTDSSYFTASIPAEDFYVWYTIDEVGTDPNVINRTGIQVDLLSTDDALTVASKTQLAINTRKFAVPDYRGLFLRGATLGRTDIGLDDPLTRFSRYNFKHSENGNGDVGSEELSRGRRHLHGVSSVANSTTIIPNIGSFLRGLSGAVGSFAFEIPGGAASGIVQIDANSPSTTTTVDTTIDENQHSESRPANSYVTYVIKY